MLNNELRRLPDGKLMISSNGDRLSYFDIGGDYSRVHPKGIGRNAETVYKLARKAFLQEQLKRVETNIAILETAIAGSMGLDTKDVLAAMPKHFERLDAERFIKAAARNIDSWPNPSRDPSLYPKPAALHLESMSPEEWAAIPYKENTSFLESKVHRANRGFYVRSKSEALFTAEYDRAGIFYHYDETITIDGEYISPDMIGLRQDGVFIFHEHLGRQDEQYAERTIRKQITYQKAGITLGKNLFFTFDNEFGEINMPLIQASIETMFFPAHRKQ